MNPVRDALAANRDRYLAELQHFLSLPSVTGDGPALDVAAAWLTARLTRLGAPVRRLRDADCPPILYAETGSGSRSVLSYTHYDVQPPDPLALWNTPPFEPVVRDGKLFARGTSDDKGDTLARIQAVEVYRQVYGELPLRVKFFVEGEEEAGSPHLELAAQEHAALLKADGALWEGGSVDEAGRFTMYCGLKGIAYFELRVRTAAQDLHSGYAPMVENPAWRLVNALKTLKDDRDTITVDGLMDHVRPASESELAFIRRIPFDGAARRTTWGIDHWVNALSDGEALERYVTAPTCTICGLRSGFIEDGDKTVLPSTAMAKLDFRLVPDLTPSLVQGLLRAHLDRRGFADIEIKSFVGITGARADVDSPVVQAAVAAASAAYGAEPVVYPSAGGSGPMHALVQGVGTPGGVMAGVGYYGMAMHAPNENIRLDDYFRHIEFLVDFFRRFAASASLT